MPRRTLMSDYRDCRTFSGIFQACTGCSDPRRKRIDGVAKPEPESFGGDETS
ncbi:hypothetical protein M378DRAFT_157461 [Amanita muscaria Koide BX008]|uniref:Uncharacterized protein n=1 Tax=Amanita muscaria (strain Koide BX008) TaxID=946122 RepID=A0A0C2T084_AMAMK|nr:hypothetical protein M378DRAFT_157461 [Amanita muscaria Koide BX008]